MTNRKLVPKKLNLNMIFLFKLIKFLTLYTLYKNIKTIDFYIRIILLIYH